LTASVRQGDLGAGDRLQLIRNGAFHVGGFVIPTLLTFLLVPLLLAYLGIEGYAVFVTFLAAGAMAAAFDGGLFWSFLREVAASSDERPVRPETSGVIATSFLALGAVRALVTAGLGISAARALGLGPETAVAVPAVGLFIALAAFFESVDAYGSAVLQGRGRFGRVNAIESVAMAFRTAGMAVVLMAGGGLVGAAAWHAASVGAGCLATLHYAGRDGSLPFRPGAWRWASIRHHLDFGLATQVDQIVGRIAGPGAVLIVGYVIGAPGAAAYNIAYRIPGAILNAVSRFAEVFFPAASAPVAGRSARRSHGRSLLDFGGRAALLLAVPLCGPLFVLAPPLLSAWVGDAATPDVVALTRLLLASAVISAAGVVPLNVLWGRAAVREVVGLSLGYLVLYVVLATVLLPRLGVVGAGWTMLGVAAVVATAALYLAHHAIESRWQLTPLRTLAGPVAALILGGGVSALIFPATPGASWLALGVAGAVGTATAAGWLLVLPWSRPPLRPAALVGRPDPASP
jgi:O-antigen/teichoic acid export membrane protein